MIEFAGLDLRSTAAARPTREGTQGDDPSGFAALLATLGSLPAEPAARADAEQCKALAGAVSDMQVHARTGDLEPYLRADQTFHRVLLEASGNEMFAALVDVVAEVLSGRTQHGMMPARPNPEAVALHDDVARAVRLGDVALAQASMTWIIDEAADALASGR